MGGSLETGRHSLGVEVDPASRLPSAIGGVAARDRHGRMLTTVHDGPAGAAVLVRNVGSCRTKRVPLAPAANLAMDSDPEVCRDQSRQGLMAGEPDQNPCPGLALSTVGV
jgi:hypothetical protein